MTLKPVMLEQFSSLYHIGIVPGVLYSGEICFW